MEDCAATCWLPLVEGLLRYKPDSRALFAVGPFLNCGMDCPDIRDVQAAGFASRGQLCPSISAPVVIDVDVGTAGSRGPVLLRTPDGMSIWKGERASSRTGTNR